MCGHSARSWKTSEIPRREGVTTALTLPAGGLVSGQAAAVDLAGATQAEALVRASAAVVVHLGLRADGSRAATLSDLRVLLEDARDFPGLEEPWSRNASRPFAAAPRDLLALQPALAGSPPLMVHVNRASDIEALLRLVDDLAAGVYANITAQLVLRLWIVS